MRVLRDNWPCEGDAAPPLSGTQRQLCAVSVPRAVRSFRDRAFCAPLVGPRLGRGCARTGREPVGDTAARRAEDLYRRCLRIGERAAWSETDALQRETTRPDPAVAHGGDDEH